MAPDGEVLLNYPYTTATKTITSNDSNIFCGRTRTARQIDHLQRTLSDLSFEKSKESSDRRLPTISVVEDAKCTCCGMSEECTPGYIHRVRDHFCGNWVCGLCAEAVEEETEKTGMKKEALAVHMSVCTRFNRIGRKQPVMEQVEAMREMLKRCSRRAKSNRPMETNAEKGCLTRSSSCIPAITRGI